MALLKFVQSWKYNLDEGMCFPFMTVAKTHERADTNLSDLPARNLIRKKVTPGQATSRLRSPTETTTQDDAYPIISAGRLTDNSKVIQTHSTNLRKQSSHLWLEFDTPKTALLTDYG
jgi:hypothetical protein